MQNILYARSVWKHLIIWNPFNSQARIMISKKPSNLHLYIAM